MGEFQILASAWKVLELRINFPNPGRFQVTNWICETEFPKFGSNCQSNCYRSHSRAQISQIKKRKAGFKPLENQIRKPVFPISDRLLETL